MEPFHVERDGNKIIVNREPKTEEEFEKFASMVEDALVYVFMVDNSHIIYRKEGAT